MKDESGHLVSFSFLRKVYLERSRFTAALHFKTRRMLRGHKPKGIAYQFSSPFDITQTYVSGNEALAQMHGVHG